jgi:hypothetical protein
MATLEWGVAGSDTVAVHCSLEGLAGLAKYQHACVASASNGLAGQAAGAATAGTSSSCGWCITCDECGVGNCLPNLGAACFLSTSRLVCVASRRPVGSASFPVVMFTFCL